ncbi:negative regulator of systemic acquired resistance SNI1-like [Pistacia vera]|uniref:negative regulator of systemic acquired resistance SNI1-like n=1 Tax=Pistacia vera TaxID=55513 RepID=UPI00126345CE|nr:negative regulator of systemic acquired resistance SNI1-like [Pistacia vera]
MARSSRRSNITGMEENTLAILESTEAKDSQDANDDRIAFLEAVQAASIIPENGTAPTCKMYRAVFQILRIGTSLELMMSSYELLNELDKRFPRVYVSEASSDGSHELVVVDEAWSPFFLGSNVACSERKAGGEISGGPLDFSCFTLLIQELVEVANGTKVKAIDTKHLRNMLLFQYLVSLLEGDFIPRNIVYEETINWALLRESLLNMLLGSRRTNYKSLMKDCLSILCCLCPAHTGVISGHGCPENSFRKPSEDCNTPLVFALLEVGKSSCIAMQKLLIMIMKLDISKKKADMQGLTTRADGVRTPLMDIILDELTYDRDMLSPFLQVFSEPKWKLEIVVQYFLKYTTTKPSVCTRRSNSPKDDATFKGVLNCFSNSISTKNIMKKISTDIVQLLLAHAFQQQQYAIPCDFLKWASFGFYRTSKFATGFTPLQPKPLDSIIDIQRAKDKSSEDLASIWDDGLE